MIIPIAYLLALCGLIIALARLGRLRIRLAIHTEALTAMVLKLLQASNRRSAVKICDAVPLAPLALGIKAMLEADGEGDEGHERLATLGTRRCMRCGPRCVVGGGWGESASA